RRRHTRFSRDWSSDVCSSDLVANRRLPALGLFEVGRVFLDEELERLALLTRGPRASNGRGDGLAADFFSFKGILESLAGLVGAEDRKSVGRGRGTDTVVAGYA